MLFLDIFDKRSSNFGFQILFGSEKMHFSYQGKSFNAENTDEVLSLFNEESYAVVNGRVIQPGFSLEEYGLTEGFQVEEVPRMLGGKVHGSLARAGKVKGQTPKVDAEEKKKAKTGRAKRRMQYNRRFVNVVPSFGKKKGPNSNS
ncbi:unnamed protein product [Oikopleura dioica]|uniref:Uncharacterized protein n=2 Tax=Oikopleura dioica TaxID=34765 RepID=E4YS43_OIKDI|nr:unnamed protein product [Oikopleura dioica]